jgi:hypothetical protein
MLVGHHNRHIHELDACSILSFHFRTFFGHPWVGGLSIQTSLVKNWKMVLSFRSCNILSSMWWVLARNYGCVDLSWNIECLSIVTLRIRNTVNYVFTLLCDSRTFLQISGANISLLDLIHVQVSLQCLVINCLNMFMYFGMQLNVQLSSEMFS